MLIGPNWVLFLLGVPVLVLRETTERPEGIEAGTLKLAGTDEEKIFELANELLSNKATHEKMSKASNPYGDGNASKRIGEAILDYFNLGGSMSRNSMGKQVFIPKSG